MPHLVFVQSDCEPELRGLEVLKTKLTVCLLLVVFSCLVEPRSAAAKPYNLLVIMTDEWSISGTGMYENPRDPSEQSRKKKRKSKS